MAVSTLAAFKTELSTSLSDLKDRLSSAQIEFSANQALDELGFTLPVTNSSRSYWLIQRGKRHALDLLRTSAAFRFKYKQISLNQRFEHLDKIIEKMDVDFAKALDTDPDLMGIDLVGTFGTYLGNGLVYDQHGNDISRLLKDAGEDNDGYRERYIY